MQASNQTLRPLITILSALPFRLFSIHLTVQSSVPHFLSLPIRTLWETLSDGLPRAMVTAPSYWSTRSIWPMLSDIEFNFWAVLHRARCRSWLSLWVSSSLGCSVLLWFSGHISNFELGKSSPVKAVPLYSWPSWVQLRSRDQDSFLSRILSFRKKLRKILPYRAYIGLSGLIREKVKCQLLQKLVSVLWQWYSGVIPWLFLSQAFCTARANDSVTVPLVTLGMLIRWEPGALHWGNSSLGIFLSNSSGGSPLFLAAASTAGKEPEFMHEESTCPNKENC